jgi:hypothetical protein
VTLLTIEPAASGPKLYHNTNCDIVAPVKKKKKKKKF